MTENSETRTHRMMAACENVVAKLADPLVDVSGVAGVVLVVTYAPSEALAQIAIPTIGAIAGGKRYLEYRSKRKQ